MSLVELNELSFFSFLRCFYPTPTKRDGKIIAQRCGEIGIAEGHPAFDRETRSLSYAYAVVINHQLKPVR